MQTILCMTFQLLCLQKLMDTKRRKLNYSGRLTSGKVYHTLTQCVGPVIRSDLRWPDAIRPHTRAGWSRTNGKQGRAYTKWFILSRLRMRSAMRFRQNGGRSLDVFVLSCRFDHSSGKSVDEASSSSFLKETKRHQRWVPKDCQRPGLPKGSYSLLNLTYSPGFEWLWSLKEGLRLVDVWLR